MKIRTRIVLGFLIAIVAGFYYLVDWIVDNLEPRYRESVEESLVDTASILAAIVAEDVVDGRLQTEKVAQALKAVYQKKFSANIYDLVKDHVDLRVYVTDSVGLVIYHSFDEQAIGEDYSEWRDVHRTLIGEYGARTTRDNREDPTTTVLYIAAPIEVEGEVIGVLTVGKPTRGIKDFIERARKRIAFGGTIACLVVLLLATLISAWITRPIENLTAYARAVRDGKRVKLPSLGKGEVEDLGLAFEEMRDALEGKQYVEQYIQTLTHELKSPLTAIHGAAELLPEEMPTEKREQFLSNIKREAVRMRQMVERLLELSSIESLKGLEAAKELELKQIAEEVIELMSPASDSLGVKLELEIKDEPKMLGDSFLLQRALANLVQNALDFSRSGDLVKIVLAKADGFVEMSVIDRGTGIPDYARDKIFQRFYSLKRPDSNRKGSGLGLSFVQEICALHGGCIEINEQPEGGVSAQMKFPI